MLLPVLTAYEKSTSPSASRCRSAISACPTRRWTRASPRPRPTLGRRLVILGHHYQRDEVIKFADYTGDSYKLAQQVSKHPDAEFIVFCGVHFMAESADVLSARSPAGDPAGPRRRLLDGRHGRRRAARDVLERSRADGRRIGVVPVTYINSAAAIKAFCGEHGGVVCTSSNAAATLRWAWERGERILLPARSASRPQHRLQDGRAARRDGRLGSERDLGRPRSRRGEARAHHSLEGPLLGSHALHGAADREHSARQHPGVRVIVHPEVPWDVVQAADDSGSTEYIIKQVKNSPAGSVWAVGTEIHLVNRLAQRSAARPDGAVARSVRLPLLDDVPRLAEPPALGARRPGRRRGPQPHRRAGRSEALDEGRARPHAVHPVDRPAVAPDHRVATDDCSDSRAQGRPESASTDRQGGRPMAHTLPPLPYRARRARTSHRQADDGDSSRQASRGLRQQPERRAREASRAAVEERRGSAARASAPCRKTSAPPCATTAAATRTTRCSGRSWARTPAARRPARSPTRSTPRSAASTSSRKSSRRPASAASAAAGRG